MDPNARTGETFQLVKSVSDKHLDLLRPSARFCSIFRGQGKDASDHVRSKYTLLRDVEDSQVGLYDKPLPCFGCGIGWFSFLLGFFFPLVWYYATVLYFWNVRRDPRERAGLAASAIAQEIVNGAGSCMFGHLVSRCSCSTVIASPPRLKLHSWLLQRRQHSLLQNRVPWMCR
ncbi:uncharacterized protein LOC111021894 isoform X2 [Momordica charantia]|uniref:Uncharacterized protein LOC111021894 isoform X2 n=1 Tax=Momordica charantia TaxID=3673 RepID=A0A6J1DKD4_MOMCH|nr:uncharacterized protein LOC111021894 isoform X2 [Momordica charantia]